MREGDNEKIAKDIPQFLADNKIDSVSQLQNFLSQGDEDSTPLQEQLVKFNSWIKEQIPSTSEVPIPILKHSTSHSSLDCHTGEDETKEINSIEEVINVVRDAGTKGYKVRVGGAQHSVPGAVFGDAKEKVIRIRLDGELRKIQHLEAGLFEVGAGCNLGINPDDPNSNEENSFNQHVDKLGYALPIMGGISQQTIGGFMSTSSAGGSLPFGFDQCIVNITIVDGVGNVRKLTKDTDEFNAAAVSMGLYGVIVKVQLQCQERFNVHGTEQMVIFQESTLKNGDAFINASKKDQYFRTLWIPKESVDEGRVIDYIANQNTNLSESIEPYEHPLASCAQNVGAAVAFTAANWFDQSKIEWLRPLNHFILDLINPLQKEPIKFNDVWWKAIPVDDMASLSDKVQFTEIYVDINQSNEVIQCLSEMFSQDRSTIGSFAIEVYPAKKSPFWLSMSFGYDAIRINPFWLTYNKRGDMDEYFGNFWNALLTKFPSARLHWGKHFPKLGETFGSTDNEDEISSRTIGGDYCEKSYPHFSRWLTLRQKFDPSNVFLTNYWAGLLNIKQDMEIDEQVREETNTREAGDSSASSSSSSEED